MRGKPRSITLNELFILAFLAIQPSYLSRNDYLSTPSSLMKGEKHGYSLIMLNSVTPKWTGFLPRRAITFCQIRGSEALLSSYPVSYLGGET